MRIHSRHANQYITIHETQLNRTLAKLVVWMESVIATDASRPRCSCCGQTENLQSGYAGGQLSWRCPGAAREALSRGE